VVKNFESEFEKPKLRFGYLGGPAIDRGNIRELAELPPLETLRAKFSRSFAGTGAKTCGRDPDAGVAIGSNHQDADGTARVREWL
jgi:hypothetical protein